MVAAVHARVAESAAALREVGRNRDLRRLQLARSAAAFGVYSYAVVFAVVAYRAGGAAAVGAVAVARTLPTAVLSPLGGVTADRFSRRTVIASADLGRAVIVSGAAVAIAAGWASTGVVLLLAGLAATMGTAASPARAALLPSLARTPGELTAGNVVGNAIENVASFVGPIIAALFLAFASATAAFAVSAVACALAALTTLRIRDQGPPQAPSTRTGLIRKLTAGFEVIGTDARVRLAALLYGLQTLVGGAIGVAMVVAAITVLDLGESGVGLVSSALSAGGLVGALVALAVIGGSRLSLGLRFGMVLWGVPISLVGLWPDPALALALFVAVGVGESVADVAGETLLQRTIPDELLARAFGALGTLMFGALTLGSLLGPLVLGVLGTRGALVALGLVLPAAALAASRPLRRLDDVATIPAAVELLRGVPLFTPLPETVLERLASAAESVEFAAGRDAFREGERGDRFYVVSEGEVSITDGGRELARAGPGDFFGEIALLRDMPRTATATAATDVAAYALSREAFLGAVAGYAESTAAANAIVDARLGRALRRSVTAG